MADNTDYIDRLNKLSLLDVGDLADNVKLNTIVKFAELKEKNPTWNNKQICQAIGISSSTFNRIRNDLGVPSFYRYKVPLRRTSNQPKREYTPKRDKEGKEIKRGRKKKAIEAGSVLKEEVKQEDVTTDNVNGST